MNVLPSFFMFLIISICLLTSSMTSFSFNSDGCFIFLSSLCHGLTSISSVSFFDSISSSFSCIFIPCFSSLSDWICSDGVTWSATILNGNWRSGIYVLFEKSIDKPI